MSNVKVAVRVRPLTKREEEQGAKLVVAVEGDNIRVTNLKAPSYQEHDSRTKMRQFVFDFCYWSADGSKRRYASQEMIYEDLGTKVLDAVFEGFNACVLAYGQSGSGKTYTMMGYNGDLGLTPRICQGLFDRMSKVQDKRLTFRTEVSFLEIYNERVGDLLRTAPCRRQKHALRVREHPKFGPCVQDLSKHVVTDFNAVQALIERGIQNRSVAATKMHDHSSRSHAIFTINFTQARVDEELPSEVVSKIHLVDLAGSERATVHMSKIRLKEGANINKSLVALGGVICALAEKSMSQWSLDSLSSSRSHASSPGESATVSSTPLGQHRGQQPFIPYRDSVLTWLLKDSLGGNSKTIMVATISPASTAYNETISTLRYTQRAKRIVNKPVVNEDPNVKLIRELRAEITRLRGMLSNSQAAGQLELPAGNTMPVAEIILRNQDKAQELTKMWIEKWHYFQKQVQELSCKTCIHRNNMGNLVDCETPYLVGISDLPSAGVQIFYLKEGDMVIGNSTENGNAPDIILTGEKMTTEHCRLSLQEGTATITPIDASECLLNGNSISCPVTLSQGDMVQLGKNNTLKFVDPSQCVGNLENANCEDVVGQEILALPGIQKILTDIPSSDSLSEDLEKKSAHRCSGLQVLENFNKILEMKFHSPTMCPTCSRQSCEWADDSSVSQSKNSPDDSGICDTTNLDLFTDIDGFPDDALDQRTSPVDPAPEYIYSGKSEGEEYDDWSDADDFSYFAFDDGKTTLDEQPKETDSHSETSGTYSQHIDYLAIPMQSLVSRRLSPIQECDTRSPSPAPDQNNPIPDRAAIPSAKKNHTSSEQKASIPVTSMQDSVASVQPIEVKETLSSSEESTENDGSISCDSLDADSLDDREEDTSCNSESVFCAQIPYLDTDGPVNKHTVIDSNSDFPPIKKTVDTIKGAADETNNQLDVFYHPESRDKRANSIAGFSRQHTEAAFSDSSSGRPMDVTRSTPMLTKSCNLRQCDRGLRQKCGYSSSSEEEWDVGQAGRNQRSYSVPSRNDSKRTLNYVRFLREKSCGDYTSSSEDESCQHGLFGKPQVKSFKAKERFEKIVLENKRKKRRKTAPKKSKRKSCSPITKISEFVLSSDRCTSPHPLPQPEFNRPNIREISVQTNDESAYAPELHSNSSETIKDLAAKILNAMPMDKNCFHAVHVKATNLPGLVINPEDQDYISAFNRDPDNICSHQDLDQRVESATHLDNFYDHVKVPERRRQNYAISHNIHSQQTPVHDHTKGHDSDSQHNITSSKDTNKIMQLSTDLDDIFESKMDHDVPIFHANCKGPHLDMDKISQAVAEPDSNMNRIADESLENHDRILFCHSDQDMTSNLNKNLDRIPQQGIDADVSSLQDDYFSKISVLDKEWYGGKQPEQFSQLVIDEDEIEKVHKFPDDDGLAERSGIEDYCFECSSFIHHQDPCKCSRSDPTEDQDSDWISNRTEQEKPFTSTLDCSDLTFETRSAIQDCSEYDHPARLEVSHEFVGIFDGEMSETDTSQRLRSHGFMDDDQSNNINSCKEYFDNSSIELEIHDGDSKPSDLTCWSDIAAGQHELSDQLHISMHSKPRETGLFGSSSSIWGQSWPSCDSLTMVYMGPEWGSTETNMIASIQSLEDLNDSDFSEGHQEALERFVVKSMQSRQKDSPMRFQNAFSAPCSYHSSSDSMALNNDCCKNSNETFTICSTDDPMAAIWERQYAETGKVANEAIATGMAQATYTDEWTKETRPYKDLWTIHSYSIDDLQSHSSCLCKGMHNTANSCCNEAGNMSMGSTCTAEVSTQTESDSGIQTDTTVRSDATQTSVMFSSSGTQSVPACTSATSQTAPIQTEVFVQTDPVRCEAGSQTNPAAKDSSSQSKCPENKEVQTVWSKEEACVQTEWHCVDANTNTDCNAVAVGSEITDEDSVLKNEQNSLEEILLTETKLPNLEPTSNTEESEEKHVKEALPEDLVHEAMFLEEEFKPENIEPGSDIENTAEKNLLDSTYVQGPLLLEDVLLSEEIMEPMVEHIDGDLLQEIAVVADKKATETLDESLASEVGLLEENYEREMTMLDGLSREYTCASEPALPDGKLTPEPEALPCKMFTQQQYQANSGYAPEARSSEKKHLKQDKDSSANMMPVTNQTFSGIQLPLFQSGIYIGFQGNPRQMRTLDMKITFNESADNVASANLSLQQDNSQCWNTAFSENPAPEYKCAGISSKELPMKSKELVAFSGSTFANTLLTNFGNEMEEPTNSLEATTTSIKSEAVKPNEDFLKQEDAVTEITESKESKEKCIVDLKEIAFAKSVSQEINEQFTRSLESNEKLAKSIEKLTESELVIPEEETNKTFMKCETVLADASRSMEISENFMELKVAGLEKINPLEPVEKLSESEVDIFADNYESLETNQACAESDETMDAEEEIRLQDVYETEKVKNAGTCNKQTSTGNLFENIANVEREDKSCSFGGVGGSIIGVQKTCFCQDHSLGYADDREVALWSKPDNVFKESIMQYFDNKFHSLENAVKASELGLREMSLRFSGNQEERQSSAPSFSIHPEDSTIQRPLHDDRFQDCQLYESSFFLDANMGILPTSETDGQTPRQMKCDNNIDAGNESGEPTKIKMPDQIYAAFSEDVKNQESKCDQVLQKARKCQSEVFSDSEVQQPKSKTCNVSLDCSDEEYYKLPNVDISHKHQKHRSSSKGAVSKPIKRDHTETSKKMSVRQRSAQRHCHRSATKPQVQRAFPTSFHSDSAKKQESVPKDSTLVESKLESEAHLEVQQNLEESKEVPCSVTKQGTSGKLPHNCPRIAKCTCDLEDAAPQPIAEMNSEAEQTGEDLPEDIVQLLRECRMVRKKAWKEIALAHQQLSITHTTSKRNMCAIHRIESFEGS